MATSITPRMDSFSSGEMPAVDPDRVVDIERKHREVAHFLESHRYDALLLQKPANFAWFTSGGDNSRAGSSETVASLFITADARVVVTENSDSSQLFDRELPGLGFQLKERPWHDPRNGMAGDLCRGRMVCSDSGFGRTTDVSMHIAGMRMPLSEIECQRLRSLGRLVAHAVEATGRQCRQGQTEAEIAGEVAHRLIKRQVLPERIQVAADGQTQRYRHWSYGSDRVERYCTISAVGRQHGLCVAASRTISFGDPPDVLRTTHYRAMLVHATGMYFSQANWEMFEIWKRIARIYEKFGWTNEWQQASQADLIGYAVSEVPLVPKSEFRIAPQMPIYWHPTVGPAVGGDTVLVGQDRFELLTPMEEWPRLKVEVKGVPIWCPDILRRTVVEPGMRSLESDSGDSVLGVNFSDSTLNGRSVDSVLE